MKRLFALMLLCLMLVSGVAFAGAPAGTTGAAPTTMIGPLNGTKLELVNNNAGYEISSILALNTATAVAFIQFFDQPCAGVTLGTTKPSWVVPVRASDWSFVAYPISMQFFTPICVAATTTPNGLTGAAASVFMQVFTP